MLLKVFISLLVLLILTFMPADSDEQRTDKQWLQALAGLLAVYYLITSSLYLF